MLNVSDLEALSHDAAIERVVAATDDELGQLLLNYSHTEATRLLWVSILTTAGFRLLNMHFTTQLRRTADGNLERY
jgi:hypothetical protein